MSHAFRDRRRHKVFFFVGRSVHPFYREQLNFVPDGFEYLGSHADLKGPAFVRPELWRVGRLASVDRAMTAAALVGLSFLGHVRRTRIQHPDGVSLIHSAQHLPSGTQLPYVVDFEDVGVFSFYQRRALTRPWALRRLMSALGGERCRYILPWTNAARRGLFAAVGAENAAKIAARTIAVLPAIRPTAIRPRKRGRGSLRVLFIGSAFLGKGGPEAVLAVERLRKTHDVELDLVTFVPEAWRRRVEGDDSLRVHVRLAPEQMRELYAAAHVLLFPTHIDTLGFAAMEAMAAGMPVVASDHFALPELIEHGVSGLLFKHENSLYRPDALVRYPTFIPTRYPSSFVRRLNTPSDGYVDRIATELSRLAEDQEQYDRLSEGALERVRHGVLSAHRRRAELATIYGRAVA